MNRIEWEWQYNRFHDANETASDIQRLRKLHVEMEQAVAIAYGWQEYCGLQTQEVSMTARLLETPVSFDQFIEWLPEASEQRYELHRGVIIEMPKPRGKHSQIAGYTALKVGIEIERLGLPYFIPKECIVRSLDKKSGVFFVPTYLINFPADLLNQLDML